MSTQKNEHNPDGGGSPLFYPKAVGEPTRNEPELKPCPFCGGNASYHSRFDVKCGVCGAEINSLNPAAAWNRRITPPTDTTGSGREGETPTPETDALIKRSAVYSEDAIAFLDYIDLAKRLERQRDAALAKNADLLKSENDQLADIEALTSHITTDVDAPETSGSVVEKVEWLLAQVEALRRDGDRDGINYPVTVDAKLLRSLIWTGDAIVREPNQGRLATWRELREKVCAQMKEPAIDSAQRQEAE